MEQVNRLLCYAILMAAMEAAKSFARMSDSFTVTLKNASDVMMYEVGEVLQGYETVTAIDKDTGTLTLATDHYALFTAIYHARQAL